MQRFRVRSFRRGALVGAVVGAAFVALAACGGDDPAAAGGACSLASDCQLGLICVTQSGKGACTSDLTKVAGQSEPDGAVAATDGAAKDATTTSEGGAVKDSGGGKPDTGAPDSGPSDSGAG